MCIRWAVQRKTVVIPKSTKPERLREVCVFSWEQIIFSLTLYIDLRQLPYSIFKSKRYSFVFSVNILHLWSHACAPFLRLILAVLLFQYVDLILKHIVSEWELQISLPVHKWWSKDDSTCCFQLITMVVDHKFRTSVLPILSLTKKIWQLLQQWTGTIITCGQMTGTAFLCSLRSSMTFQAPISFNVHQCTSRNPSYVLGFHYQRK